MKEINGVTVLVLAGTEYHVSYKKIYSEDYNYGANVDGRCGSYASFFEGLRLETIVNADTNKKITDPYLLKEIRKKLNERF